MENKYVIINKETIQKRIEELKTSQPDWFKKGFEDNFKLNYLKEILSNSIPLEPEIEKAFDEGQTRSLGLTKKKRLYITIKIKNMTTEQMIFIFIPMLFIIIGFISINLTKKEDVIMAWSALSLFMSAVLLLVSLISTEMMMLYKKEAENKCPQYEKIDNVYKLKQ